jgi:hypothetical protein
MALLTNLKVAVAGVTALASKDGADVVADTSQPAGSPATSAFVLTDVHGRKVVRAIEDALFYGLKVRRAGYHMCTIPRHAYDEPKLMASRVQRSSDGDTKHAPHFWHFLHVLQSRANSMLFAPTLLVVGNSATVRTERGLVRSQMQR